MASLTTDGVKYLDAGNHNTVLTRMNVGVLETSTDGGVTWTSEIAAGAITAITGDVTATGPGSVASTVHALPLDATPAAAPATPATGKAAVYVDSTSKALAVKNDAGTVSHTVQTIAPVASTYLTGIADSGAVSAAIPVPTDFNSRTVVTLGAPGTDITFSGLTGDTDLGYEIFFWLDTSTAGLVTLQPNSLNTNQNTYQIYSSGTSDPHTVTNATLLIINGPTTGKVVGRIRMSSKTGAQRFFQCQLYDVQDALGMNNIGIWNETATAITSLRIHCSGANGFNTGSFAVLTKLGVY